MVLSATIDCNKADREAKKAENRGTKHNSKYDRTECKEEKIKSSSLCVLMHVSLHSSCAS